MKTKHWIILLALLLAGSILLSIPVLLPGAPARFARVTSQGKLVRQVDLLLDQQFTVTTAEGGSNVVTVKDGKIAVTEASCPDHYCMQRGYCSSGAQIVCLPNQLIIQFVGEQAFDAVAE